MEQKSGFAGQLRYLQMLLPQLLVPQQSAALMKVSTQQGTSVWPLCSLPQVEWEIPAPVGQQEYIARSTAACHF